MGLDGPGTQDDPPQARRARRRGPDHGAGPPPRGGPPGHARVSVRRRARPGLLLLQRASEWATGMGARKAVTNQVTTTPGDGRHSATYSDAVIPPTCGNPTQ